MGAVKRFLTFPGSRVTLKGSAEACDTAELLLGCLNLEGNEDSDRKKIDQLTSSYARTNVDFPKIEYEKKQ